MKATKVRFGEFQGIGSVFRFTLVQMLKSKGNIVSIVILIVFSIFFIPVMSVFQMDGSAFTELSGKETISDIENVYLIKETGIEPFCRKC